MNKRISTPTPDKRSAFEMEDHMPLKSVKREKKGLVKMKFPANFKCAKKS